MLRALTNEITIAFNPAEWRKGFESLRNLDARKFAANLRTLLPQLILYYVLLSPLVAAPLYNTMLFHPAMNGPYYGHQIAHVPIRNVTFSSGNGAKLHGWYLSPPGARYVVLLSHGNGGNLTFRVPLIAMFLREQAAVLAYDYEGYGKSEGSADLNKICADGVAAYDWLRTHGWSSKQIVLFGESLGSGVACDVASNHECAGIVLQSAYTSLPELARDKLPLMRLYPDWTFPRELPNRRILESQKVPMLFVHGMQDRLISPSHSKMIAAALTSRPNRSQANLVLLPNAGHNDIYEVDNAAYASALHKFFAELR